MSTVATTERVRGGPRLGAASAAGVGAGAFVLTVLLPLLGPGQVMLVDWVVGPRPRAPRELWGFGLSPAGPLYAFLTVVLRALPGWSRLLPFVIFAAVAIFAIGRLVERSNGVFLAGAVLYVVNPFVLDRMHAGHGGVLLGYAVLPLLFVRWRSDRGWTAAEGVALGLILGIAALMTPHMLFIGGILAVAVMAARALKDRSVVVAGAVAGLVVLALNAFWILPLFGSHTNVPSVGLLDLNLFRTRPDPTYGLGLNVLGLRGFWRDEFRQGLSAWPLLLAALLLVVIVGAVVSLRRRETGHVAVALLAAGVVGFFLALGDQGPTGGAFRFAFLHVPGFRIMREPQKFLALLALAYAFFYAVGARTLVQAAGKRGARAAIFLLVVLLPVAYTPKMFWGFGGQVKPSKFPSSWEQADRIMGGGPERALALPWHLYMAFSWTGGRTVANPAPSYFRRDVIAGDNIELGRLRTQSTDPRSRYLRFLFDHSETTPRFGNLVAPLGIRYVLLMKEQDWKAYDWLYRKTDLRLVMDTPDLALFENTEPVSLVYAPRAELRVRNLDHVLEVAKKVRLTDYAIRLDPSAPAPADVPVAPPPAPVVARRTIPVNYAVGETAAPFLVLAEPFDRDWAYQGRHAEPNLGATNLFRVPGDRIASRSSIFYTRWRLQVLGYVISGACLLAIVAFLVLNRRRERLTGL